MFKCLNVYLFFMFKKISILTLLLTVLVFGGFGCKSNNQGTISSVKAVTINYWTVYDDVTQLEKFAAEYKQLRPYVTINIRQVRYDEFDSLFTNALADDVSPDIISVHVGWLGKYLSRLSPIPASVNVVRMIPKGGMANDQFDIVAETNAMPSLKSIKSSYVNTVYDDIVRGGVAYGLPMALDTLAIYYNKDLLDRAGVPEPPTTWEEFVAAVKKCTKLNRDGKITQSATALGTGNNISNAFDILSLFMMQSGVSMADGASVTFSNTLSRAEVSDPAFKALNFYTDFARPNKEAYSWDESMGDSLEQFVRGKVVFYFGFAYDYTTIKSQAPGMNLSVLPMLQLRPEAPVNVANYWVESVPKKSKHQNEAWDFIRFITAPDKVKTYTEATFRPTPLRSQIKDQLENENLSPFTSQILFIENWYRGREIDGAKQAFETLITKYLKPYSGTEKKELEYRANLIIDAARTVQQTM